MLLLALLQMAAPVGAAVVDPAPTPVSHADHLGSPDEKGCEPFHDDAFCSACRVLFTQPLDARAGSAPGVPPHDTGADPCDRATGIPDGPTDPPLRARAPPRV